MAKKIFFGNYKGGVGKTTSVFQVGINLAEVYGKKVFLLDLDPQASLSRICMHLLNTDLEDVEVTKTFNYLIELYSHSFRKYSKFDILSSNYSGPSKYIKSAIFTKDFKKSSGSLSFIPTRMDITNSRINDLAEQIGKYSMGIIGIAQLMEDIEKNPFINFDYILIDCPPSINCIIQSVFLKSDYFIIPTIANEISTAGVMDYVTVIEKTILKYTYDPAIGGIILEKVFSKPPKLIGVLETMAQKRSENKSNEVLSGLNQELEKNLIPKLKKFKIYARDNMDYIFKKQIYCLDNKTNPDNYGLPYMTEMAKRHDEYNELSGQLIDICKQEDDKE